MITYNDMSEREALLLKALEAIQDSGCRPGFPGFMNKADIVARADRAVAAFMDNLRAEICLLNLIGRQVDERQS